MYIASDRGPNNEPHDHMSAKQERKHLALMETTHLGSSPKVESLLDETRNLKPVGVRSSFKHYLSELWQRRHFIWRESKNKVLHKTSETFLGPLWLVLSPLLNAAFYWVIFGIVLGVSRGMENFVAFIIIGVLMFQFTSSVIGQGARSITGAKSMIKAFAFPRAAIPISLVVRETLSQLVIIVVMVTMILLIPPHVSVSVEWLALPAVLALQVILNLGIAFVFSRLGYRLPDFTQAVTFLVRVLMYGSGVIFPVTRFVDQDSWIMIIVELNPIYVMLEAYRSILMENTLPEASTWLILGGWALGLLLVGFMYFWNAEEDYARERE